jgi:hypothetical protein
MNFETRGPNLEFLRFLATEGQLPFFVDYLTSFRASPWQGLEPGVCVEFVLSIKHTLANNPSINLLFERYLLAHRLIADAQTPPEIIECIDAQISLERHFEGIQPKIFFNSRWACVPVPVTAEGKGYIRWFVVGCIEDEKLPALWPKWATPLMDQDSQSAVRVAAQAAFSNVSGNQNNSLYLFPLLMANERCQVYGSSLGLPLAIGFMQVLKNKPISGKFLATGAIHASGSVSEVQGLAEKQACASQYEHFSLFIYPSANHPMPAADSMEALQVDNLEQAWMFARWYQASNGNRLAALSLMAKDARAFLDNMNSVPWQWVRHLKHRGVLSTIIKDIVDSSALLLRYITNLEKQLDEWRLDEAGTYLSMLSGGAITHAGEKSPLAAFRCFNAALTLANHRGDTEAAETAVTNADGLFTRAMQGDLDLCADYLNRRQVARHNRFCFEPNLHGHLKKILKVLEARHATQCEFGCPTDTVLAGIYGTVAQNFAFCGPAYISKAVRYARMAIDAFGGGRVPEYMEDALRQHAYLAYAYLDAGDHMTARENLFAYLAVADWDQVRRMRKKGQMSCWHHAALARFLADTVDQEQAEDYLKWCQEQPALMQRNDHPHQLWAYNLGRIADSLGHAADAMQWFYKSRDMCIAMKNRPTIHVMALLPLSALATSVGTGSAAKGNLLQSIIDVACSLNASHFNRLSDLEEATALEGVRKSPEIFFPFSYR